MKNKLKLFIGLSLIGYFVWYLFLKPYDYKVVFKAQTYPGTINQSIKLWSNTNNHSQFVEQENFLELNQQLQFNDSLHEYRWKIIPLTDSSSQVTVLIKDLNNSLSNRLSIPFSNTNFEKRTKSTLVDFNKKLHDHIENFKVSIVGITEDTPSTYTAYVPLEGPQFGKASAMMKNYPFLSSVLVNHQVKLNGQPFIEVSHWDRTKDSITYNFCFPIIKNDSLPQNESLHYKQFEGGKAIKAIYNGNYITSDRAWYALLDYAKKNNIAVDENPIEVFYSNPNYGGNELNWMAEIYMPLKK
ncbi:GyrI-like domain-containing protein [Arenibacter sp. 6A1]|uniref:GyrI-like domain-containing protein n=1 Tax=Arenibacter sp. 6A1 TaxID=2720391 RepID=UPI00293BF1DE|nr:GyrI-like domain-containing protein [Arenibacter sp. 6A1]